MSGGHFNYGYSPYDLEGQWRDAEINELYSDLFCSGEFAVRDYGGLYQSLDFYLCDDTGEESYRDAVKRFKDKWFKRTQEERVEFYKAKIQEYADRCKTELGVGDRSDCSGGVPSDY